MAERKKKAWTRGNGSVRQKGKQWYIRYSWNSRRVEEATSAQSRKEALTVLRNKLDGLDKGRVSVKSHTLRVRDLYPRIVNDYVVQGQKGEVLPGRWKRLEPMFGQMKVREVTHGVMERYVLDRYEQGAAPATVQYEIACLRRMIRLGAKDGDVAVLPFFPTIKVDNARKVFWEPDEFHAILNETPGYLKPLVVMAYWTGCRLGELLALEWRHIDLDNGRVTFEGVTTKNGEEKVIYLPHPALQVMVEWRQETEALMARKGTIIGHVFHRDGKWLKRYDQFKTAWCNARARLGLSHKGFHDFRRTATRRLLDAGVDDMTSMQITGHKTRSVFDRYNVRNEQDVKNAAEKLSRMA